MDAPPDIIITINDVKQAGFCASLKTRRWFLDHGFNYQSFLRSGVPAAEFLEKGDALAVKVVERKIERELIAADVSGLMITVADAKAAGKCTAGSFTFARRAGLDFSAYLASGIPAVTLIATGDPDAIDVVRHKLSRTDG